MPLRASPTTVQDAFNILGYSTSATLASDAEWINTINLLTQQITDSGSWEGCVVETLFNGSLGFITLPAQYQSVIGVDVHGWPQMVFGRFHEYSEVGPGEFISTVQGCGPLLDIGDGFCTQTDIPDGSSGTLRIKITNILDAGKTIRFTALDTNGQDVYSASGVGFNVTTVNPTVTDTNTVAKVTGIQVQTRMLSKWTLWWVDTLGVETQIGEYLPNELRPDYHRYKTGKWDSTAPIALLCRLRFMPVYAVTDFIRPGNMNAIKFGIQAINCEAANNYKEAQAAWAMCYNLLNSEHKSRRGKASYAVNINPHGSGQTPVWNSY